MLSRIWSADLSGEFAENTGGRAYVDDHAAIARSTTR
jgi:hypothetical protein